MAFVPGFEWDVFVSAASIDDAADPSGRRWVTDLVQHVVHALRQRVGADVAVRYDGADARPRPGMPADASDGAAVMLAVASPAYSNSEWCRRELAAFSGRPGSGNRVFVAERFPPDAPEEEPEALQGPPKTRFWRTSDGLTVTLSRQDLEPYLAAVAGLADRLARKLKALRSVANSRRPPDIRAVQDEEWAPLRSGSGWKPTVHAAAVSAGHVFVSFSHHDRATVDSIVEHLETAGLRCWIAHRDIPSGADFQDAIVAAIETAEAVVLVFSESANRSTEVKKELALASGHRLLVLPVRIEDVQPSGGFRYQLSALQHIDLFAGRDAGMRRLISVLRRHIMTARRGRRG